MYVMSSNNKLIRRPESSSFAFISMSLVNYSSDEEEEEEEHVKEEKHDPPPLQHTPHIASSSSVNSSATMDIAKLQTSSTINSRETSLKLPDASQLFASFDSAKESLAVNIPGSRLTSTKRSDLNGSADGPRKKISKGSLMPSRILPDTAGGSLLPPQLRGRSNVATEDLDKLFSRRQTPS